MIIINQWKDSIVNYDNIITIDIEYNSDCRWNDETKEEEMIKEWYNIKAKYLNYSAVIGEYSTKERAKEVLHDMVFSSAKIYEMPRE